MSIFFIIALRWVRYQEPNFLTVFPLCWRTHFIRPKFNGLLVNHCLVRWLMPLSLLKSLGQCPFFFYFFNTMSFVVNKLKVFTQFSFNFNFLLQASCQREFLGIQCERKGKLRWHVFPNENSVNVSWKPSTAHVFVPFSSVLIQKLCISSDQNLPWY